MTQAEDASLKADVEVILARYEADKAKSEAEESVEAAKNETGTYLQAKNLTKVADEKKKEVEIKEILAKDAELNATDTKTLRDRLDKAKMEAKVADKKVEEAK